MTISKVSTVISPKLEKRSEFEGKKEEKQMDCSHALDLTLMVLLHNV
jgi:hypothetical protein